jgi:hypothetical protein
MGYGVEVVNRGMMPRLETTDKKGKTKVSG